MIAVGTICILIRTRLPEYLGSFCTVIGPLGVRFIDVDLANHPLGRMLQCYVTETSDGLRWSTLPEQLLPIAPPGLTERTDQHEPVSA